ncbi:MAG: hypothetical protein ACRDZW_04160 [Acidimicrobiales bacterium]
MKPAGRLGRDQRGQVGGLEGLVFGVLVFVFGTLFVANAWGVVDAKLAASAAAREATRSYVESSSAADAERSATAAARDAIEGHGRRWDRTTLSLDGTGFARCTRITAAVAYRVPLVAIPLLGQHGRGLTVTARHSELVDAYRSGLDDGAGCAAP